LFLIRNDEGDSVATPKEREEKRKEERQREFDRQVDTGSLVVRQMTPEEREKYAESPKAAEERRARRARNRT
jgi:ribosomal silencing factor RsfS